MTEPTLKPLVGPGRWKRYDADATGEVIENVAASNWGDAFITVNGAVLTDFTFRDSTADNCERVLSMNDPFGKPQAIRGGHISNVRMTDCRRGGFRFRDVYDVLVEDCIALSHPDGNKDIPVGFGTGNTIAENLTFRRCEAGGFRQILTKAGQYPNGDGFSAEETTDTVTYEDCYAHDNADGGFDVKPKNLVMTRCVAERNHHNYRLWGSGTLADCLSIDPTSVHMMVTGQASASVFDIVRPTFRGGSDKLHLEVHLGTADDVITITDPVVPDGESLRVHLSDTGRLANVNIVFTEAGKPVPVQVGRDGAFKQTVPGGVDGRVMVTVTETVTTTTTRTYDAEDPDA